MARPYSSNRRDRDKEDTPQHTFIAVSRNQGRIKNHESSDINAFNEPCGKGQTFVPFTSACQLIKRLIFQIGMCLVGRHSALSVSIVLNYEIMLVLDRKGVGEIMG